MKKLWVGDCYTMDYSPFAHGASILIEKAVSFENSQVEIDPNGRFIILQGKLWGEVLVLVNSCAQNYNSLSFIKAISVKMPNNRYLKYYMVWRYEYTTEPFN